MQKGFVFLTVFLTGLCVTALELTASRFLAPYFGASIFIWANIIGVVLIALSLGYFLGGRLADQYPEPRPLYFVILATGLFTLLIPFIGLPLLQASTGRGLIFGSFFAVTVLFALPLVLLGMVSPWMIRIASGDLKLVGSVAGNIYGFSTVGSIVGVFLPVFLTIPFFGTKHTIFLFGTLLLLIGLVGLSLKKRYFLISLAMLGLLLTPKNLLPHSKALILEAESPYNFLKIEQHGDAKLLMMNEGRGVQSVYRKGQVLTENYWDYAALLPFLSPGGKQYLIIGIAAGTSARIINHFSPEIAIDGVEIDKKIIELGKKHFGLSDVPARIFLEDGRMFLRHAPRKYNYIMVDVYSNEFYIPFHLATREFFEETQQSMEENGILIMNIAFKREERLTEFLESTLASVFKDVRVVKEKTNTLLFASQKFERANAQVPEELQPLFENFWQNASPARKTLTPFTDNFAPVERYTIFYASTSQPKNPETRNRTHR